MVLSRFADRCIFCPTTDSLPTEGKIRRTIPFCDGHLEVWTQRTAPSTEPQLFVLKLGGTGGRAERATLHPFEVWSDLAGEVWAPNPPGYGGSSGKATLATFASAAESVFRTLQQTADGRPIVVTGNSLGTATALHLAAIQSGIAGLVLRNPPPLRELIRRKFGWRTLGLGPLLVGSRIPPELDSIANARLANVPAVILTSLKDRMVPPAIQRQVINAYQGPKRIVELAGADHAFELTEPQQMEYASALRWLQAQLALSPPK
jgi:pimeloyl-ACP methyl ester carboxylesterase